MDYIKNEMKYPSIADLVNSGGRLEIGYIYEMGVSALATDEGGTVWEGKKSYDSIDTALKDAEIGIGKWIKENW